MLLHHRFEVAPIDVLHHQVIALTNPIGIDCPDNVGMIDRCGELNLSFEPGHRDFVFDQVGRHDLQRDDSLERAAFGFQHRTHATLTEHIEQPVFPQEQLALAGQKLPGLPLRDPVPFDEVFRCRNCIQTARNVIRHGHLLGCQQMAFAKRVHKGLGGRGGHAGWD